VVFDTDYLVIGAGASGLAFTDTLAAEADAVVTVIDRQPAAGGHWLHAYPFLRLHTPSAYYGVDSLALGEDRVDVAGENAGFYERATGAEVRAYFAEVAARLTQTGRVRMLMCHEHLGGGTDGERIRDLTTGETHDVSVRRKVVDARYLEASIPATHAAPFAVAADVAVVPVNDLPAAAESASRYTVLGSGKTAADACIWLLDNGVDPDRVRWIRPRDAWFHDRAHFQPLDQVGGILDGFAADAEAAAHAQSLRDLFERLEAAGRLTRIDPSSPATMYRGTMLSRREVDALRRITDVVRLGHVRRIEADRIVLERGETDTAADVVHIDCTALGLNNAPATPIFQPGRIVVQQVRHLSPSFNAALIAFVEAHRESDADKNRLCPPNAYPSGIEDWPRMMTRTWRTEPLFLSEPDVSAWVAASRLNLVGALPSHANDPSVQAALGRYLTYLEPAVDRLSQLDGNAPTRSLGGGIH
jgi:hypothetical protein